MKNIALWLFLSGLQILWPPTLGAQSSILEAYVQEALQQNLSLTTEKLRKEKQQNRIEQAQKLWGFQLDLKASYLLAEGGREIAFPIGDLFNPINGTLNSLTGSNRFPTNLENQNIQLTPNNFLDVQLSLNKPIFNSQLKYNQRIQEDLLAFHDLDLALQEKEITFQIKSAYYNYLKTFAALKVLDETDTLLQEILAFNKKLIKYDKATIDILSDVEFQIAELSSQRATILEQQALAKSYFNLLLDKDFASEIEIDPNLLKLETNTPRALVALQEQALGARKEFQKLTLANTINLLNQERVQKQRLPTLGVSAGIGLQTENFDFDLGGPLYTIALGMNWNILDGGLRKKKIESFQVDQKMLANQRQQLTQQVKIQVTETYLKLQSLEAKMAAEAIAVQSARKSYRAIRKKYENDKAILIQLTQAQHRLTTSALSQALSQYDYLILLAELEKITGA